MVLKGRCLCGASSYEVSGEAKFTIQCYCRDCQRVSGGGSLPQLAVAQDAFTSAGPIKSYGQKSASGNDLKFDFCSVCGSPLFKTTSMASDLVFVNAGSLDDPSTFEIGRKVFETSRQPWDES